MYQTLKKKKHTKKMVGKICPKIKLTPPCNPLPQSNKALEKDQVTCGFYIF